METSNPWNVVDLDIYLRYNCPQCEAKCETKDLFVNHAIETHPEAKEYLQNTEHLFPIVDIKEEKVDPDYRDSLLNEGYEYVDPPYDEDTEEVEEKPLKVRKRKKPKKEPKEPAEIKGEFQCYRCGDIFDLASKVETHIKETHSCSSHAKKFYGPKRNYQCHACNLMHETVEHLNNHFCNFINCLKPNVYDCEICQTKFSTRDELKRHNMALHVTEKFFCDKCDYKCK